MHFSFFQILVVLQLISNQLVSDAFFMLVMATKSATVIQTSKKDSWSPFHRTSNGLKCQFSNIKHTWKCSFFGNRTQTPYFWLRTNGRLTSNIVRLVARFAELLIQLTWTSFFWTSNGLECNCLKVMESSVFVQIWSTVLTSLQFSSAAFFLEKCKLVHCAFFSSIAFWGRRRRMNWANFALQRARVVRCWF